MMMSEARLRESAQGAGLPEAPAEFHEVIGSTQARALELASEGAPEWTLVAAGHQTGGRGRLGRTWLDEAGRSLLFSVVFRPAVEPGYLGLLSLLAGGSVATACRDIAAVPAGCKWPNDVLVRGRKVAGLLAEARVTGGRVEHAVLGVGVNLEEPPRGLPQATGLEGADPGDLLTAFLREFRERYRPDDESLAAGEVLTFYYGMCDTLGREVRARTLDGRTVEGRAVHIGKEGSLIIDARSGSRVSVAFGEIEHLD